MHEPPLTAQTQESQNAILSHCQRSKQQQQHSHSHSHSHSPHHSRHTSPHSHSQQQQQPQPQPQQQQQQQQQQSHAHSHHHHYRRKRRQATGSGSLPGAHTSNNHHGNNNTNTSSSRHSNGCSSSNRRRHRSVTDMSSNSINADREIQEIMMVRKTCCTELAQCFAEDLYGSSSRRPSSCCTSSDYCYQTDSTSLYGDSRSTLSRNNSIKSASAAIRKQQRLNNRQPSYTSISLRGLNDSSLTSIFDRAKQTASASGLPEYACSPSPIRWSFLAGDNDNNGSKSSTTEIEQRSVEREEEDKMDAWHMPEPEKKPCRKISYQDDDEGPSTSAAAAAARKRRSSSYHCEFEEEEASTTAILYHQDPGESFNNCCSNYIQCNTYLDQDLQITSEDIHQYLSKGQQSIDSSDILNNSKNYPFQPSNTLEFQYKNNFQQNGNQNVDQKETNLNQMEDHHHHHQQQQQHHHHNQQQQTTNINLSTSSNNINIVFNSNMQSNAGTATGGNEVKFINNCNRSYDYTNMSGHLNFDKPLGIVELPKEFGVIGGGHADASINSTTASEHSSSLPSPTPMPHHFESFDAASEHNLMSPCLGSPGSVNPSGDDSFVHLHHHHHSHPHSHQHQHQQQHTHYTHSHPHSHASSASASASSSHHQHQQHQHMHPYNMADVEQFRLGNAFKKVRKRARKYTDFLRKK
ncbi:glucose transporter type 1-like [Drosophila tropicalis]|uniref:glucose transporter type 1-like n=1 Tax=Drosophila tropicalis TaxID=46794 RepID=UPI0035ABD1D6